MLLLDLELVVLLRVLGGKEGDEEFDDEVVLWKKKEKMEESWDL